MNYKALEDNLKKFTDRIVDLGGELQEFKISPPATLEDIHKKEKLLGYSFPELFKKILTNFSSSFSIRWFLPEEFKLNPPYNEIFCGVFNWDLESIMDYEEMKKTSIEMSFPNIKDSYDAVWHNKLAIHSVGNGDFLAFDLSEENSGAIVYLSGTGGTGHGLVVGNNFETLLEEWSEIGFVGSESFQWEIFIEKDRGGIRADTQMAQGFKKEIGLSKLY